MTARRQQFPQKATPETESILRYLEWAESREVDPWLKDDYRISWITVRFAAKGYSEPHVSATYQVLGCHPEQVWARILAIRRAKLGSLYDVVTAEQFPSPNKAPQAAPLFKKAA